MRLLIKYYLKNQGMRGDNMKYIVREGIKNKKDHGTFNALGKARSDCEKIFNNNNYKLLNIESSFPIRNGLIGKIRQYINYYQNDKAWYKELIKLDKGDIVAIQYPLANKCSNFSRIIKRFNKKINFVLLIHDVDSIRYKDKKEELKISKIRREKEEIGVISNSNYVIVHNSFMKKELEKMGVKNKNLFELEIFDYLADSIKPNKIKSDAVIIAGNLMKEKAKYLGELYKIKNVNFNLYGKGYESKEEDKNIDYKGSFLPEELPSKLEGKFGLIWDGDSIDTCNGFYGQYMRYNNPHKVSLYLVSEIPVIVWSKSAMSKFVEENKLGFSIDSLNDINKKIKKISDKEYDIMKTNCKKISSKLLKGYYLSRIINEIEKMILK